MLAGAIIGAFIGWSRGEITRNTSELPEIKSVLGSFVGDQRDHNKRLEKILEKLAEKDAHVKTLMRTLRKTP